MNRTIFVTAFLVYSPLAWADDGAFFESKIRPVLIEHCQACHGEAKQKGGLRLDSRAALLAGGESGPAIVPSDPVKSRLLEAIRYRNTELQMPPKGQLSDAVVKDFEMWVKAGAVWPGSEKATAVKSTFDIAKRKAEHWCWQPLTSPAIPAGVGSPIDRLAKAKRGDIPANPPADPLTLLRRVSFDLTGLPPSLADIHAIESQQKSLNDLIDQYLASPAFAEHWARHWLDLVRYADTRGHEFDHPIPYAWRYRDYVIRAFASDIPYRDFVTEQIAGDRLTKPRRHADGSNESIQGTGFWLLGEEVHSPVDIRLDQADRFDNRIDVFGKSILGLTVACARCHDHKFDAISTADYYAMFTLFEASSPRFARIDDDSSIRAVGPFTSDGPAYRFESGIAIFAEPHRIVNTDHDREPGKLSEFDRTGRTLRTKTVTIGEGHFQILMHGSAAVYANVGQHTLINGPLHNGLVRKLENKQAKGFRWESIDLTAYKGLPVHFEFSPLPDSEFALADVVEAVKPPAGDLPILPPQKAIESKTRIESRLALALWESPARSGQTFIRGSHRNLGETVAARNLTALSADSPLTDGRLSLAQQLTDPAISPLTYRVFANRLWQHLFGKGIVPSVDNFGVLGEPPSHPELLDYLAKRVIESTPKQVIREIVMSDTYRMSSTESPEIETRDPGNRLIHRQNLRRLDAESIRDAMLMISGRLDRTQFGLPVPAFITPFQDGRGKPASGPLDGNGRRSVYIRSSRNFLSPFALAFDAPIPFSTVGQRQSSNVPAQALILLNDDFVKQQSKRWGDSIAKRSEIEEPIQARVGVMYRQAFGRPPTADEVKSCREFLGDSPDWPALGHALFNVKEFTFRP